MKNDFVETKRYCWARRDGNMQETIRYENSTELNQLDEKQQGIEMYVTREKIPFCHFMPFGLIFDLKNELHCSQSNGRPVAPAQCTGHCIYILFRLIK